MKLSRRDFLKIGAIAVPAVATGVYYAQGSAPHISYKQLAREGLPAELAQLGFSIRGYVDKNSEQEVAVIGERHDVPGIDQMKPKLIDYLITRCGADSLGIESTFGKPSKDLVERATEEVRADQRRFDPNSHAQSPVLGTAMMRYAHQESIPCYGLEDKETFLISTRLGVLKENAYELRQARAKGERYASYNTKPFELLLDQLQHSIIKDYVPSCTLEELTKPGNNKYLMKLAIADEIVKYPTRSEVFAEVSQRQMKEIGSKRGIVVMGNAHTVTDAKLSNTAYQDSVKCSALVITAPGAGK